MIKKMFIQNFSPKTEMLTVFFGYDFVKELMVS